MAKAKKKAGTKPAGTKRGPRITGIAKKPEEMQSARNQAVNLIVDSSVEMTQRVVRSVSERGSVPALRFLWEVAGMFPTALARKTANRRQQRRSRCWRSWGCTRNFGETRRTRKVT